MKYVVFGDSHTMYFQINEAMRSVDSNLRGVTSYVKTVGGSTISGFGKRESTLNTYELFNEYVDKVRPDFICFALGQVDLELGYFYRWFIKNEKIDVKELVARLVDSYMDQIKSSILVHNICPDQVIVKGVNLSVLTTDRQLAIKYTKGIISENIEDPEVAKQIAARMVNEYPSNIERYKNHMNFNSALKAKSEEFNYKYFDINEDIVDFSTKQVKLKYIPARYDHHLIDSIEVRLLHVRKLLEVIYR